MSFVDVIAKKRDGHALSREDVEKFVHGVSTAGVPDYQASALLMAIVIHGMSDQETASLTDAMVRSGDRVDLSDIPGTKVGQHSTGGVGDKVSIVLAPVVAACGVVLPKMSGRGLGHTGGTLDKLEAIPGFRVNLSIDEFVRMLADVGTSIVGQTASLAPADKKLYALRDVTATVPSIPLIAASIMSKKLAEGSDALVLDVKCGHGAFMKSETDARELARLMVSIGSHGGAPYRGLYHGYGGADRPCRRQRAGNRRMHRDPERSRARRPQRAGRGAGIAHLCRVGPIRGAGCRAGRSPRALLRQGIGEDAGDD